MKVLRGHQNGRMKVLREGPKYFLSLKGNSESSRYLRGGGDDKTFRLIRDLLYKFRVV